MYTSTLALLHQYDPTDILLSHTSEQSPLFGVIHTELPLSQLRLIKRKYFDVINIAYILHDIIHIISYIYGISYRIMTPSCAMQCINMCSVSLPYIIPHVDHV